MTALLGSIFGFPLSRSAKARAPAFLDGAHIAFVNARSAMAFLVARLTPGQVWLPSYLCGSILDAMRAGSADVRFYAVDERLAISDRAWLDELRPRDLVLLLDYFGFPSDDAIATQARQRGCWVLEDACQALLSSPALTQAHFRVLSPRKTVGVPDGAVLQIFDPILQAPPRLETPAADWWLGAVQASVQRALFDRAGGDRGWFPLSQAAESSQPVGPYRMSDLTRALLAHAFDYEDVARRRVANFRFLLDRLAELALLPAPLPGVVPLGFPIRCARREELRQALFAVQIFPAVHWNLRGIVPEAYEASHRLSGQILTLPCDQRCDEDALLRMTDIVLRLARP